MTAKTLAELLTITSQPPITRADYDTETAAWREIHRRFGVWLKEQPTMDKFKNGSEAYRAFLRENGVFDE